MSLSSSLSKMKAANSSNVFESGNFQTDLISINAYSVKDDNKIGPPKPLLIGTPSPSQGGEFDVLLLLHGYLMYNHFYSQLIQHIASHGFIVIAPQLYIIAGPDSSDEITATATTIDWLIKGLQDVLPPKVHPNLDKLALAGHSRGGKVAFALALQKIAKSPIKFSALIGIDPVDGMDKGQQTPPPVLTYKPKSFDFGGMPALVIGSGLGAAKRNPFFPPCAPKGVNHWDFYHECKNPAWYFLVKDYGHLDMLDNCTKGVRGVSTYWLCKNGKAREPMRNFIGGVIVSFLNAYLHGDYRDLFCIRDGHENVPVDFDEIDVRR